MTSAARTIDDCLKLLETSPDHGPTHLEIAGLYRKEGRLPSAEKHLRLALRGILTDGEAESARFQLGEVLRTLGKLDEAAGFFSAVLKSNPDNVWAHIELGDLCNRTNRPGDAEDHLRKALVHAKEAKAIEAAHFRFGELYKAQNKLKEASEHFLAALKVNPASVWARLDLGALYLQKGVFQAAEEQLTEALGFATTPETLAAAHLRLGELCRTQERLDQALRHFQAAAEINPSDIPARLELGDLYRRQGLFREAEAHLRRALELAAGNPAAEEGVHHRLGEVFRSQGKLDESIGEFLTVLEMNPSSLSAHMELGDLYAKKGRFPAAEEHLRRALALSVDGEKALFAHYRLGEMYRAQEKLEEAIAEFQTVFGMNPQHGLAMIELAKIYREQRKFSDAEKSLEKALGTPLSPTTAKWAHVELATLYQHTGKPASKSDELYRAAAAIDPDDESLRDWLDRPKPVKGFRSDVPPYRPHFTWNILSSCNYGCSYCSAPTQLNRMEDRDKQSTSVSPQQWLDIWKKVYDDYGTCRIRLSGGEPSIYRGFHEVVGGVSQWHIIQLNTNLSFDVAKFAAKANPKMVRIDASFHPEFPKMEGFLEKLRVLREAGFRLIVSVVASPPFMEHLPAFKKRVQELGCSFLVHPFYGPYNGKTYPAAYTEEEKEKIYGLHGAAKVNLEFQTDGAFHTKGKQCRMGQMYATVFPNGEVYRCCNHDYRLKLGDMTKNEFFKLLNEPTACEAATCQCWRSMVVEDEERWAWQWVDDWEVYAESNPFVRHAPKINSPH
jgi:tetratricopeptide (TPR) repeat protein